MDDAVHDGVGVDPAAEPGVPVLLAELGAEDRGDRPVARLHQLEQEGAGTVKILAHFPTAP